MTKKEKDVKTSAELKMYFIGIDITDLVDCVNIFVIKTDCFSDVFEDVV